MAARDWWSLAFWGGVLAAVITLAVFWFMRNIALRLSYDGSNYHGWQTQKSEVTDAGNTERRFSKPAGTRSM
jgi:hypothetical protein